MELIFWTAVFLVLYPYAVYPLLVWALGGVRPRPVRRARHTPRVSILIPAYNEADVIRATVANKLELYYPRELLEIIVVSDESVDGTDDIVREFAKDGVKLLRREPRRGKAAGLNAAMRHATGEIIVFSDANSLFAPDALRHLVENFADPEVGYVTGSLSFLADHDDAALSARGQGAYLRFENWLRRAETRLGSIIGVNGGCDAIRRELYVDIPEHLITDFVLPLTVLAGGHRVVFDPRVKSRELPNEDIGPEFRMRVRVALRALQGLSYMRRLFNPLKYPLAAFCLVSHKLLRYLAFVFMGVALAANIALAFTHQGYLLLLVAHLVAYLLAALALTGRAGRLSRVSAVPGYVVMSYAAFALALWKFLRGENMATWKPRQG